MSPGRRPTAEALTVPIAFLAANAVSYALLLVAAHRMTSSAYGTLSSLLGLLLVSTVPMLALQTVAARRAASDGECAGLVRGTAQIAVGSALAAAAVSPAVSLFLHLHDLTGALLVAATVPATAVLGSASGLAQGRRRFRRLAGLILLGTGGRSLGGIVGLLVGSSPDATVAGVAVGVTLAAAAAVLRAATPRRVADAVRYRDRSRFAVETLHAGHAHGAFLLLTSIDVLLARHSLSSSDAGVYAVGSVVTRAALWLPQSVVLLLFASLAEAHSHRAAARRALLTVAALGALTVAGAAVLGRVVVAVVGGHRYHELDSTIWLFALLGSLLAVLQLAVLAGLAQRDPRRAALLWTTIAVDVIAVLLVGDDLTPVRLVSILTAVTAVAAAASTWVMLRQAGTRQVALAAGHAAGENVGSNPGPKFAATPEGSG